MIIDLGLLAPGHAFVLAIMTVKACLVCHSLNQLLLVCHHVQTFIVFYYSRRVAAVVEDTEDEVTEAAVLKNVSRDSEQQSVDLKIK